MGNSSVSVEFLTVLVALLVALSVASERLVEIVKSLIPWLDKEKQNPKTEGRRRAALQALAVICGIATAFLSRPAIKGYLPDPMQTPVVFAALGFLTSGGSGFWNGILSYVKNAKDLKKNEVLKLAGGK